MTEWLDGQGNWYKGNLHMHTTLSDGVLGPEAAIGLYRQAGYDFIALTDHWHQSEESQKDGFLLLSGCEFDTGDMVHSPVFHIVGAGMEQPIRLPRDPSRKPQAIIDAVNAAGGAAILAHPAWSVTDPADCLELRGLAGAEIYNSVSGLPWNARPESGLYFDIWGLHGMLLPCVAADDSHFYAGEQTRSYIMVRAESLTAPAIRRALRSGNFYASQGPEFRSLRMRGDIVEVECSRVETVVFYSNTVWCEDRVTAGPVTGARYRVKPTDRYLRVELIDAEGRRAWSSPAAVNGPVTKK